MKKCKDCRSEIEDEARKCKYCQGFLDWRRFINQAAIFFSVIVAGITLLAYIGPQIEYIMNYSTDIKSKYIRTKESHDVVISIQNSGNHYGILTSAKLNFNLTHKVSDKLIDYLVENYTPEYLEKLQDLKYNNNLPWPDFIVFLEKKLGKLSPKKLKLIKKTTYFSNAFNAEHIPFEFIIADNSISGRIEPNESKLLKLTFHRKDGERNYKDFYQFMKSSKSALAFAKSNVCQLELEYLTYDGISKTIKAYPNNCSIYFPDILLWAKIIQREERNE